MWSAVAELARSASSTPFVVLASLLKGFLASFTATMDVTIVAPNELARGLEPSLSSVLGCFFDFFVLRTDLSSARTLREVVRLEHAVVMQSQSEVDIPCALVTDEYLDRPLWRVALNVIASDDDAPPSSVMFGVHLQVDPVATPRHRMVDMAWAVFGASGALFLSVDRFDSATANRIAAAFAAFIAKALANPDAPVLQEG
jgi:non-ribosomal peptide synthetase component F